MCLAGRVHVWLAFNPRQWIKRRRTADRPVPLESSVCWRRDIVPMFPRLCRYEVRPQSEQPTCRLAHATLAPSAREPLQSSLLRGFGCRCGACDVGYYGFSGRCHECGNRYLVLFLACAVPALTILGITLFLFWGGKVDPKKGESLPLSCRYIRSVDVLSHRGAGVLQLMRQADFWSWSRLWTR
jgi:hypothetical protein